MRQLFAVAKCYLQIKADAHFPDLQRELMLTEDRLAAAHRFCSANTREMRRLCETIPPQVVTGLFTFRAGEHFELGGEAARVTPGVSPGVV